MIKNIKQIVKDTLYVSKITKTNNKKLIILLAVFLSQFIALSDILIILLFTNLLSSETVIPSFISNNLSLLESSFFLPLLILLRYIFQYLQNTTLKKMEFSVQNNLKVHLLNEVFNKKNYSSADAFYYINTLTTHVAFFYSSIANFFNFLLQTSAFLVYLLFTEPKTISTFLIGVVFLTFPITYLIKKAREYMHLSFTTAHNANQEIERVVDNVFLIKLLNKENDEIARFDRAVKDHLFSAYNNYKFTILNSYLPSFITIFLLSVVSIFFFDSFNITFAFVGVTLRLFQSIGQLSNSINQVVNSHVHIDEFYKIEMSKPKVNKENYVFIDKNTHSNLAIKFSNVGFKYFNSKDYIFKNIDLNLKKNKHTLITGINGSGKSTLLGLMAGVYFPNRGEVAVISKDFGYIGPNPLVLPGSLRENLLYGNENKNISDEELISKIKEFKLFNNDDEINLNRDIDSKSLSSGQIQKVSFIRALLTKPAILFLDESTSNLDKESKSLVFKILSNYKITIINSSHDFDMLSLADDHYLIDVFEDRREIKKIN